MSLLPRIAVLLPVLLACAAAAAAGRAPAVSVRLEPPITPRHEPALLILEVEVDREDPAGWPGLVERLDEQLDGLFGEPVVATQSLPDGRLRVTTTLTLDPRFLGEYPLGPLRLQWGETNEMVTLPGPVLVVRDLTEAEWEALARMQPNAAAPLPPRPLDWYLSVLILAAAMLVLALAIWWWRTRDKEDFYAPATLAPWEAAIEALRALKEKKFPERGLHEPYFVELSAILRTYIERRFHLHAPEQTTPEFLQDASDSGLLTAEQQDFLARFLKQSDRVKFAKHVPAFEDMRASMTQLRAFIDETIPREQEVAADAQEAAA